MREYQLNGIIEKTTLTSIVPQSALVRGLITVPSNQSFILLLTDSEATAIKGKIFMGSASLTRLQGNEYFGYKPEVLASIADNSAWQKEVLADGQVIVTSATTTDDNEPLLPGQSILARRKLANAAKAKRSGSLVILTMLLDTPIEAPKAKVEKLFSYSQTRVERDRLEGLFSSLVSPKLVSNLDSVVGVKEEQLDTARAELDLATKASDSLAKKILHREYCDLRQRSAWKKELAVLEAARVKAESAFDSASSDYSDAKDLARDERDYASFVLLPFIIAVAKFAHSGNDRASKAFWGDKAKLAGIPLSENDWYALKKWAWEKAKAYCYGYILRQYTVGDSLLAYQESLPDLALNMLEELNNVNPLAKQEAIKYSSDSRLGGVKPWSTYSAYVKTVSYRPSIDQLERLYPSLNKGIITTMVNDSELGSHSWSNWHRCLIATSTAIPIIYLPVASLLVELHAQLADMDAKNKAFWAKQAELDAAKELAKQQALLAEIKRGYSETIPINRVWDKTGNIYQDANYISNGQVFFNANFFRTLENARLFFPNHGKNPYSHLIKKPTRFTSYAAKLASLPYQVASVVGTKAVTFEKQPNILALTYFATPDNKVLAVNTGYLQLLGRLGILAQVAQYCVCDSGELILRAHNGDILGAIMHVRLQKGSKDYLDLALLNSATNNNQASVAA